VLDICFTSLILTQASAALPKSPSLVAGESRSRPVHRLAS
jgi:hypothetical protein